MFLYSKWLQLDLSTRNKIASEFHIQKKNSTHVQDNVVVSDGYLIKDVEQALNVDALQKYLGSVDTDMAILMDMLVDKVNPVIYSIQEEIVEAMVPVEIVKIEPVVEVKKRDRTAKK